MLLGDVFEKLAVVEGMLAGEHFLLLDLTPTLLGLVCARLIEPFHRLHLFVVHIEKVLLFREITYI